MPTEGSFCWPVLNLGVKVLAPNTPTAVLVAFIHTFLAWHLLLCVGALTTDFYLALSLQKESTAGFVGSW